MHTRSTKYISAKCTQKPDLTRQDRSRIIPVKPQPKSVIDVLRSMSMWSFGIFRYYLLMSRSRCCSIRRQGEVCHMKPIFIYEVNVPSRQLNPGVLTASLENELRSVNLGKGPSWRQEFICENVLCMHVSCKCMHVAHVCIKIPVLVRKLWSADVVHTFHAECNSVHRSALRDSASTQTPTPRIPACGRPVGYTFGHPCGTQEPPGRVLQEAAQLWIFW